MPESASTQTMRAQLLLREKILSGEFPPGSRLLEVQLGDELGISRTPVRDALGRLVEEGLLERGRRGGFVIRSFSIADALDAIELRGVLEGMAARLAAERGVALDRLAEIERIVDCIGESLGPLCEIVELDAYSRRNAEFHLALRRLSGSVMVERELERISRLPFASPSAFIVESSGDAAFRASLVAAQAQHRAIVDAIAQREGARAEAVAREHARLARQNFEHAMTKDRESARIRASLALIVS